MSGNTGAAKGNLFIRTKTLSSRELLIKLSTFLLNPLHLCFSLIFYTLILRACWITRNTKGPYEEVKVDMTTPWQPQQDTCRLVVTQRSTHTALQVLTCSPVALHTSVFPSFIYSLLLLKYFRFPTTIAINNIKSHRPSCRFSFSLLLLIVNQFWSIFQHFLWGCFWDLLSPLWLLCPYHSSFSPSSF